ncbi:MAG TPA: hypothetical protein VI279_12460 [Rhodocyclaceae bacterium]
MKQAFVPILALALSAVLPTAHAEHRLFPTDILEKGEADLWFLYSQYSYSQSFVWDVYPGRQKLERTNEYIEARYGLGSDWQVGAGLSYNSSYRLHTDYDLGQHYLNTRNGGRGNPYFWADYGLFNSKDGRFTLKGQFVTSLRTADDRVTAYTSRLTAGWEAGSGLKLWSQYGETQSLGGHTTGLVKIGAHQIFGDHLTFTAAAHYNVSAGQSSNTNVRSNGVGLGALVEVAHNTYINPSITIDRIGTETSRRSPTRWIATDTKYIEIAAYHLF